MKTVEQLRREGYKVRVIHRRRYVTNEYYFAEFIMSKFEYSEYSKSATLGYAVPLLGPDCRSGETTVEITAPNGATAVATAICSDKDNFNRKLGVTKALGRALGKLGV